MYLTVADLLTAIGNLTGITWYIINETLTDRASKIMCDMHASLTFFSSISSFLWTVMIGVHLHLCLVQNKAKFARKLTGMFHILGWIVPGNVTTILLLISSLCACEIIGSGCRELELVPSFPTVVLD